MRLQKLLHLVAYERVRETSWVSYLAEAPFMRTVRVSELPGLVLVSCLAFLLSSCGGGAGSPPPPPASNPVPAIQSVSPSSATAGTANFTLTISGSNFLPSSTLTWNNAQQKVIFVSASELTTSVSATQLAAPGTVQLLVSNPQPGGGQASTSFNISAPATPAVASVSPSTVTVGGPAFTLTVSGSNFVTASAVQWNGVNQPTTYVDNAHLTAAIPASAITASNAGNLPITVATPAPGGGSSNSMPLLVEYPLPSITSLSPNAIPVGNTTFTLTVVGNNFFSGATVYLNSISRVTQFVSSTQLTASILASDVTGPAGQIAITVENPPPSAGISSVSSIVLQNPAPIISSVTPSSVLAGNPTNVTLTGSGFLAGAAVQIGNQLFPGSVSSATSLEATLDVPVGITTLTVTNPAPTVGVSNGLSVTGTAAGPGLSLTVASVDSSGNTVADSGGGAVSSTGRYYSFAVNGAPPSTAFQWLLSVRDTCLGAPTGCVANTVQDPTTVPYYPTGISADGRYIASVVNNGTKTQTLTLYDVCTGAPVGCVPTPTTLGSIPGYVAGTNSPPYITPNARYVSGFLLLQPGTGSGLAYIADTCVGAAPGCAITTIPQVTVVGSPLILSDDGQYFAYSAGGPILLHDSCLSAAPGCSPSDSAISTANCWTPSITGDAQYAAYSCNDGLKLQATCLNALPSCNPAPIQVDPSPASLPNLSAGGRYVAYVPNTATINGQTLTNAMVFVFDSCIGAGSGCTQKSVPLCLNSSGAVANSRCDLTGMTVDGQYVVFSSAATNLGQTPPVYGTPPSQYVYSVAYIVKNPLF